MNRLYFAMATNIARCYEMHNRWLRVDQKSVLWLDERKSYILYCVRTPYKLSQLSIWEETLRKKIRIFTFNQSYNRETVRFGFIFIWSVSTLNGFTSHLLLYLWLNYKYPTKQVPRLLQFPRYYTAAGACWINLFRVVIPLKQIQTRNQFHVPYSTEQIHDNARKLCYVITA